MDRAAGRGIGRLTVVFGSVMDGAAGKVIGRLMVLIDIAPPRATDKGIESLMAVIGSDADRAAGIFIDRMMIVFGSMDGVAVDALGHTTMLRLTRSRGGLSAVGSVASLDRHLECRVRSDSEGSDGYTKSAGARERP
ncbi:hypothetical protein PG991_011859 [Apiospora marii]|uniref:Uncharacterized protein n=1 Tax=Apiospora marii TaxID=335849 RepID=A0ABR1RFC6_9PEZI